VDNDVGMFITSSQDQSIRLSEVPEFINFLSFYFSSYFQVMLKETCAKHLGEYNLFGDVKCYR